MGGLGGLILAGALPVAGHWARRRAEPACALGGGGIVPDYRLEIIDAGGGHHESCCLSCAHLWLKNEPSAPRSIKVVDEASGQGLDAATAWCVRSSVVAARRRKSMAGKVMAQVPRKQSANPSRSFPLIFACY